jgi:archaellum biogenesis protein FlaJ (TadC family)
MPPDDAPAPTAARASARRWLLVAGALQLIAMLFVMSGLVELTPLTMTFSVGGAGMLLAVAAGIYVVIVVRDLRRRDVL